MPSVLLFIHIELVDNLLYHKNYFIFKYYEVAEIKWGGWYIRNWWGNFPSFSKMGGGYFGYETTYYSVYILYSIKKNSYYA